MALREAIEYAKQNPNSAFAKELQKRIQSGTYNTELQAMGVDTGLRGYGAKPQMQETPAPAPEPTWGDRIKEGLVAGVAPAVSAFKYAKPVAEALTTSERNFGESMGTAIQENIPTAANPYNWGGLARGKSVESMDLKATRDKANASDSQRMDVVKKIIQDIPRLEAEGKDTTQLKNIVRDEMARGGIKQEDLYGASVQKTPLQIGGEALGVGVDALAVGQFAPTLKATKTGMQAANIGKAVVPTTAKSVLKQGAKNVVENAAVGYGFDVAQNLQGGKEGTDALKPGLGTAMGAAVPAAITAGQLGVMGAKKIAPKLLAYTSDVPEQAFDIMLKRREGVTRNLKAGTTPKQSLQNAQLAVKDLRKTMTKDWQEATDAIAQEFKGKRVGLSETDVSNLIKLSDEFGFDVPQNPYSASANEWIDTLKSINEIPKLTLTVSPKGAGIRKFKDTLKELVVNSFGGPGGSVDKLYKNYSTKKSVFDAANDIVNAYSTGKPIKQATALNRLQVVFNENKAGYLEAILELEKATGRDILSKVAANKFSSRMPLQYSAAASGLIQKKGVFDKALDIVAFPLTSPRVAGWIARGIDKAGKASANPEVTEAMSKLLYKENNAVDKAVINAGKDLVSGKVGGMSIQDVSKMKGSNNPRYIQLMESAEKFGSNYQRLIDEGLSETNPKVIQAKKAMEDARAKADEIMRADYDPKVQAEATANPANQVATTGQKTLARAQAEYKKMSQEYLGQYTDKKTGMVEFNTDNWRAMFPEYVGTNAMDVHEASSYLNNKLFSEYLDIAKNKGNKKVAILAGGGGSGKGSVASKTVSGNGYPVLLDQVSGDYDKLVAKIKMIEDKGMKVDYVFVDRNPESAYVGGVVKRAVNSYAKGETPRTVPHLVAISDNIKARKVALRFIQENPNKPFAIVDNNYASPAQTKIYTNRNRQEAIRFLEDSVYNEKEIIENVRKQVQELYEQGKIPDDIKRGLIGE